MYKFNECDVKVQKASFKDNNLTIILDNNSDEDIVIKSIFLRKDDEIKDASEIIEESFKKEINQIIKGLEGKEINISCEFLPVEIWVLFEGDLIEIFPQKFIEK